MSKPTIRREQIAGMNIHYINYSLDYFLDSQQKAGFKTIELWCAAPHIWLDHITYFDALEIAKKIAARNLKVQVLTPENCTYPYQFAAKEPEHIERSFGYFSNGICFAEELGCKYMEVNSGWGYWSENRSEAWKRSREMLCRLADFASKHNITLVMEAIRPEESQLVINVASAKQMISEVNHKNLKAMIDTCAMGVAGETLQDWFSAFGEDLRHMHFIDGEPYGHLIWGDGNHHLGQFIETLNQNHYEGFLGQEITHSGYYDDPATHDLRNMKNFERYMQD